MSKKEARREEKRLRATRYELSLTPAILRHGCLSVLWAASSHESFQPPFPVWEGETISVSSSWTHLAGHVPVLHKSQWDGIISGILFFFFLILFKYSWFTMLCWFLLYRNQQSESVTARQTHLVFHILFQCGLSQGIRGVLKRFFCQAFC